jgi:hypothetical protein
MLTLCGVTFRTCNGSKSTIKVPATPDILNSSLDVQVMKPVEKRESVDGTV